MKQVLRDKDMLRELMPGNCVESLTAFRIFSQVKALLAKGAAPELGRVVADVSGADRGAAAFAVCFDSLGRPLVDQGCSGQILLDISRVSSGNRDRLLASVRRAVTCGELMQGLCCSPKYRSASILGIYSTCLAATSVDQFRVLRAPGGEIAGAMIWLRISEYTATRVQQDANCSVHPSEWNEGSDVWWRDIALTSAGVETFLLQVLEDTFGAPKRVFLSVSGSKVGRVVAKPFPWSRKLELAEWICTQAIK